MSTAAANPGRVYLHNTGTFYTGMVGPTHGAKLATERDRLRKSRAYRDHAARGDGNIAGHLETYITHPFIDGFQPEVNLGRTKVLVLVRYNKLDAATGDHLEARTDPRRSVTN